MNQSISPILIDLIFGVFLPFGPTLRCRTTGLLPDYCIAMASCHYSGLSHEISLEIFTRLKMPACISQRIQIHHDVSFAFSYKGQLISEPEVISLAFKSPKKPTKNLLEFLPYLASKMGQIKKINKTTLLS